MPQLIPVTHSNNVYISVKSLKMRLANCEHQQ